MEPDPIESRLSELKAAESAAAAADQELHRLLESFCVKMRPHPAVPFLSRAAAASGEEIEVRQGWCVGGVFSSIYGLRNPGRDFITALPRFPDDYCVQGYAGLGICTDGRPVELHLGEDNSYGAYFQDAYALSERGWDGSTCEAYFTFNSFGDDPQSVLDRLTAAFAETLHQRESEPSGSDTGKPSSEGAQQATRLLTRAKRIREWDEWEGRAGEELFSVEDPVERLVQMVSLLEDSPVPAIPKPWANLWRKLFPSVRQGASIDLMESPPWDHREVLEWFLGNVDVPASELRFKRYVEGGRWRDSRWEEYTELGWNFDNGSTERRDPETTIWSQLVVLVNGELRRPLGEDMPSQFGFNARALRRMGELAALSSLPSYPDIETVYFIDRYGHRSRLYKDGAEVFWDIDFD